MRRKKSFMVAERKNWSKFDDENERRWVSGKAAFYEVVGTRLGRSLMVRKCLGFNGRTMGRNVSQQA